MNSLQKLFGQKFEFLKIESESSLTTPIISPHKARLFHTSFYTCGTTLFAHCQG
jgi:hypothetical protein